MPIYNMVDLRAAANAAGIDGSDEFLIQDYARLARLDPIYVANQLGYDGGYSTKNAERFSAATDRYQSSLYDVAGQLAGAVGMGSAQKWLDRQRASNAFQADVASARAHDLGAVDSWKDVHGLSDFGDYAVGLGIQSYPYMLEAAAGGMAARGLMSGTRAALGAAAAGSPEALAARTALTRGSMAGGVAASYPSSVGDILSNQREQIEQTGGEMAPGAAFLGGIPYAAANVFSPVEMAAARGGLVRNMLRPLDMLGAAKDASLRATIGGGLARMGATGAITAVQEGANELTQEYINQGFGRQAVNPQIDFFNPESNERFGESFIGGAVLGGLLGGAGGYRRSAEWQREQEERRKQDAAAQRFRGLPVGTQGELGLNEPNAPWSPFTNDLDRERSLDGSTQAQQAEYESLRQQVGAIEAEFQRFQDARQNGMAYNGPFADERVLRQAQQAYAPARARLDELETLQNRQEAMWGDTGQGQMNLPFYPQRQPNYKDPNRTGAFVPPIIGGEPEPRPTSVYVPGQEQPNAQYALRIPPLVEPEAQGDMFPMDRGDLRGLAMRAPTYGAGPRPEAPAPTDALGRPVGPEPTYDNNAPMPLFERQPTSMVRTAYPRYGRGSVEDRMRQQVGELTGGKWGNSLRSLVQETVDGRLSPAEALDALDEMSDSLDRSRLRPDNIENRQLQIEAARVVIGEYGSSMTNAQAQEGASRARPGTQMAAPARDDEASAQIARENSARRMDWLRRTSALESLDARQTDRQRREVADARRSILMDVLDADPPPGTALMRFNQALKSLGYRQGANAEEAATILRYKEAKSAFANDYVEPSTPNKWNPYENVGPKPRKRKPKAAPAAAAPAAAAPAAAAPAAKTDLETLAEALANPPEIAPAPKSDIKGFVSALLDQAAAEVTEEENKSETVPAGKRRPAEVKFDHKNGAGTATNESVTAGMRRVAENDDIALEDQSRVGAVMVTTINRTHDGARGRASDVLKALASWADEHHERLLLMPAASGALKQDELKKWYERNGFVEQADGAMLRQPVKHRKKGADTLTTKGMDYAKAKVRFGNLKRMMEQVKSLPETDALRVQVEKDYFAAEKAIQDAEKALDKLDKPAPASKPVPPKAPDVAPADRPLSREEIETKLKQPVTQAEKDEAAARAKAQEQEELDMVATDLREYLRKIAEDVPRGVYGRQEREQYLKDRAAELQIAADTSAFSSVRKAAREAIEKRVHMKHRPTKLESRSSKRPVKRTGRLVSGIDDPLFDNQVTDRYDVHTKSLAPGIVENRYHNLRDVLQAQLAFLESTDGADTLSNMIGSGAQRRLLRTLLSVPGLDRVQFMYSNYKAESGTKGHRSFGSWNRLNNMVQMFRGGGLNTLLHEAVHAVTQSSMDFHIYRNDKGEWKASSALGRDFLKLYEEAQSYHLARNEYGVTSPFEFIAEAFSNPDFQRMLNAMDPVKGIDRPGRSAWDQFVNIVLDVLNAINKLFTESANNKTLLEQVLRTGSEFVFDPADASGQLDAYEASRAELNGVPQPEVTELNQGTGDVLEHAAPAEETTSRFDMPEPDPVGRMQYFANTVKAGMSNWRRVPGALGWFSLRQLQELFPRSELVQKYVKNIMRMESLAGQLASEVARVVTPWRNLSNDLQVSLGRVALEATMLRGHVDVEWDSPLNDHLRVATDEYETAENRKEFDRVKQMYDALPDNVKELYKSGRDAMKKLWDLRAQAKLKEIRRAYLPELSNYFDNAALDKLISNDGNIRSDMLGAAEASTLPYSVKRAMRSLVHDAEAHWEEQQEMRGPYFPLVRFGNFVVIAKSATFKRAHKTFIDARDALQVLYDTEGPDTEEGMKALDASIQEARKDMNRAKRALDLLKGKQEHYGVRFFETDWEAEAYENKLRGNPDRGIEPDPLVKTYDLEVYREQRAKHYQQFDSASPHFVRKLETELRRALPKTDLGAVREAVRDVYIRSLPDRAALKSELRRLNVVGAKSGEMMRGFAQRGVAHANAIARMEHNGDLQELLKELRDSSDADEMAVGDEFAKRALKSMMPPERNKAFERMAQAAHLTFLGMSPSYFLINASQPWTISLPIMAARYGWHDSGAALREASLEVVRELRVLRAEEGRKLKDASVPFATARSFRFDIQPDRLGRTDMERQMLTELYNEGLINITIEHDLGAVSAGEDENLFDRVNQMAATPAHLVEVVNRIATSLAVFRLEQRKQIEQHSSPEEGFAESVRRATSVVADTHLDYTAANAPRLMRPDSFGGLGRLIWQFKKYTQGMLYLNAKLISDVRRMKKGDPVWNENTKALAYLWGMTAGVAGAAGVPVAGGVGLLLRAVSKMWDDDDEPDLTQMAYNGLKDAIGETAARALVKGLPAAAGLDLSVRLSQASLTNPTQFVNWSKDGRDLWANIMLSMGGPASAMVANWFDAAKVASSDPAKAWQLVMPKVLSDPMKAYDRINRGIVSRSGNELVAKDELNAFQQAMRAVGFETTKVSDLYETRSSLNEAKAKQSEVRSRLMREYSEATENGEPTGAIYDRIAAFNVRNPNAAITMKTLHESAKRRRTGREDLMYGTRVGKRYQDVLDQIQ